MSSSSLPRSIDDSPRFARVIIRVVLLALGISFIILLGRWCWKRQIAGSGGIPIPGEIVIAVPHYRQADPRWKADSLGMTPGTLGTEGCAVASASMTLSHYGMSVDPAMLNRFLTEHEGYEGAGWIRWESAAEFRSGMVEKAYEDLPSYALIDGNLLQGNPVIVRIRRPDGITHFVVIVGKRGLDYLIRDPAAADDGKIYPLAELGVPIEALRYYQRIPWKS